MSNFIGIDWGQRKIGVAYADHETSIAFALEAISHTEDVYIQLEDIAQEYGADTYIIGLSESENQNDNSEDIRSFGQSLQKHTGHDVVYAPEMMSTREAHSNLKEAYKKGIAAHDDAEAARIILQNWIEHQ